MVVFFQMATSLETKLGNMAIHHFKIQQQSTIEENIHLSTKNKTHTHCRPPSNPDGWVVSVGHGHDEAPGLEGQEVGQVPARELVVDDREVRAGEAGLAPLHHVHRAQGPVPRDRSKRCSG